MSPRKDPLWPAEALESRLALSGWSPRIFAKDQITTNEDEATPVHLRVADAPNKSLTVKIVASDGWLSLGDKTNPYPFKALKGNPRQINKALRSMSYRPPTDSDRPETINVFVNDGTKSSYRKINVKIAPVNDPPEITQQNTEMGRDGGLRWTGQMFWDKDSANLTVSIKSDKGSVQISDPKAINSNGSATIRGDLNTINQIFSEKGKIRIVGAISGDAKITIRASDGNISTTRSVTAFAKESAFANARDAVESRIAGKDPATAKPIFSLADHANSRYERNKESWVSDLDTTPISPWNDCAGIFMAGTLVSPRHVVYATHFAMSIGTKIRFVTKDNQVVERTIINATSPKYTGMYFPDITVAVLDSDVPSSIGFAKVLPENWGPYMEDRPDLPCLALDQEEKALVTNLQYLNEYAAFDRPRDQTTRAFYEDIVWGDSGNPAFMIVDDQLVLLTVWTFGAGGAGTSIVKQSEQINKMMSDLGGGYQLTRVDLGGFREL